MTQAGGPAASIRQRLLDRARRDRRPFAELLQYYAMERFLYRLSRSAHADRFVLKGALMLHVWSAPELRPTMDIDVLGRMSNDEAAVADRIRDIMAVDVEADGLVFDPASVRTERITEAAEYEGIRVRFRGMLDTARIHMQVDIGIGDDVHPAPRPCTFPTIFDSPPPRLLGYSRESAVAEKVEAMVKLGELNSRMKDFFDVRLLARGFDFDGETLAEALRRTFERRRTAIPALVAAFSPTFAAEKQVQWAAFRDRLGLESTSESFAEVVASVEDFVAPVLAALRRGTPFRSTWMAAGPWA